MSDIVVVESFYLVVGCYRAVIGVIHIQVVACKYENVVAGSFYLLYLIIGHIVVPCSYFSRMRFCTEYTFYDESIG